MKHIVVVATLLLSGCGSQALADEPPLFDQFKALCEANLGDLDKTVAAASAAGFVAEEGAEQDQTDADDATTDRAEVSLVLSTDGWTVQLGANRVRKRVKEQDATIDAATCSLTSTVAAVRSASDLRKSIGVPRDPAMPFADMYQYAVGPDGRRVPIGKTLAETGSSYIVLVRDGPPTFMMITRLTPSRAATR